MKYRLDESVALRLTAMSWEQPSIVEMWVSTVVCGTQCIAPGTEKGGAEQLVQPSSRAEQF